MIWSRELLLMPVVDMLSGRFPQIPPQLSHPEFDAVLEVHYEKQLRRIAGPWAAQA